MTEHRGDPGDMALKALERIAAHEKLCAERWSHVWKLLIALLVATILGWAVPKSALSHGIAQWVQLDAETSWCCGPRDCYPVPGRVYVTQAGWSVLGLEGAIRSGSRGYYERATPDNAPWACQTPDAHLRCIIVPRGMS